MPDPRARLKTTLSAAPHAAELLTHLLGDGRALLGAEPGSLYAEITNGHRLIAHRLRCGGVDVREVWQPTSDQAKAARAVDRGYGGGG